MERCAAAWLITLSLSCTDPVPPGGTYVGLDDTAAIGLTLPDREGDADADADADADTDTDADADSDTEVDTDPFGPTDTGTDPWTGTTGFVPTCDTVIPAYVVVVEGSLVATDDSAAYWVCPHATLSYTGHAAKIFVEDAADVVVNGTHNFVWLTNNADMAAFAGGNQVLYEAGATINDESLLGNTYQACADVTYDDTLAPIPGCN